MSRTMIISFVSLFGGVLMFFGVEFTEEMRQSLIDNIEMVVGGILVVYGVIMGLLRQVTDSPMAKGIKGFFGIRDSGEENEQNQ